MSPNAAIGGGISYGGTIQVANVQRFGCSVEVGLSGSPERTASLISIVVPRAQSSLPFSIKGGSWGPVILLE